MDDCLYCLQKTIPKLNRSNIYRCLKRHGIQRLPKSPLIQRKISSKKFKKYPIGYFPVDITEVRTKEGKQQMYVAVDRCLIAGKDKIEYKGEKTKEELWEKYYIQAPAQRPGNP